MTADEMAGGGGAKSLLEGNKKKAKVRGAFRQELTTEQKDEIKEAFDLFDATGSGQINLQDLKVALRALGFEPARQEIKRLTQSLSKPKESRDYDRDKEGEVKVDFNGFLNIMTTKMSERDADSELKKAFILFSNQKDHINLEDLQYISKELGEDMTEDELREMIFEANRKNRDGSVGMEEFLSILKKD